MPADLPPGYDIATVLYMYRNTVMALQAACHVADIVTDTTTVTLQGKNLTKGIGAAMTMTMEQLIEVGMTLTEQKNEDWTAMPIRSP